MKLNSLKLWDFRNYTNASFDFCDGVNVIWGENGRGKTNILEAVYMLSGSRSWRGAKTEDIVRWDSSFARISACAERGGRDFNFDITFVPKQKAKVLINDIPVRKKQAMSEVLRCVLFSPEDLFLIKGSAANRRDLMDDCLCQLSPLYGNILSNYELVLKNKQRLLRDGEDFRILPELNAQLAYYSADIIIYRSRLTEALKSHAQAIHNSISGGKEELDLSYKTVSGVDASLKKEEINQIVLNRLNTLKDAETASKSCLEGIHRDDIEVFIKNREARRFASQGQSRTAAIALKFAQRELLRDGEDYPLLLLDDVLSELDEPRQSFILNNAEKGQTIITCCVKPDILSRGANFMDIPTGFIDRAER